MGNYYFRNSGDDNNSGSINSPFKSIGKFNQVFANAKMGDTFNFYSGDVFYGSLLVSRSGALGYPITIGAYGEGEKPVISGVTEIKDWISLGDNIWESEAIAGGLSAVNIVTVNDKPVGAGRYPHADAPNGGYLTIDSVSGIDSITDADLPSTTNFAGADVVIRTKRWTIDRMRITHHTSHTLTYAGGQTTPAKGYGYFIINSPKILGRQNEWYWNPLTKKLRMFSESRPQGVKASTKENGISLVQRSYIKISGLKIDGFNIRGISVEGGVKNTVENCTIINSGDTAIYGYNSTYFSVQKNEVSDSLNNGIDMAYGTSYALIRNNIVDRTYMIAGLGGSFQAKGLSINIRGTGTICEFNTVLNSGFMGIYFNNINDILIRNNVIKGFCSVKDDGGGIYSYTGGKARFVNWNRIIEGNIIMDGTGAIAGQPNQTGAFSNSAYGFYPDVSASDIIFKNNFLSNCGRAAIYMRPGTNNIQVVGNTLSGSIYLLYVVRHDDQDCYNNTIEGNYFYSQGDQLNVKMDNFDNAANPTLGKMNNNFYLSSKAELWSRRSEKYTLAQWRSATPFDDNSTQKITISSDVIKMVSTGAEGLSVGLGDYIWRDLNGKIFINPLPAYSSIILIRGEFIAPEPKPLPDPEPETGTSISADSDIYTAPAEIKLTANVNKTVNKVEFFFNGKHLYTDTAAPWQSIWRNVPKNTYVFVAKATDENGVVTTSSPITVTVQ